MKLLLDTCVSGAAKTSLQAAGHDVDWSGDWPTDPGDEEILAQSYRESRVLVTLDKDFGELAVVREQPHAGMIRLVAVSASQQASICLMVVDRYRTELESGAVVTVEPGRIRIRPATSHPESS